MLHPERIKQMYDKIRCRGCHLQGGGNEAATGRKTSVLPADISQFVANYTQGVATGWQPRKTGTLPVNIYKYYLFRCRARPRTRKIKKEIEGHRKRLLEKLKKAATAATEQKITV